MCMHKLMRNVVYDIYYFVTMFMVGCIQSSAYTGAQGTWVGLFGKKVVKMFAGFFPRVTIYNIRVWKVTILHRFSYILNMWVFWYAKDVSLLQRFATVILHQRQFSFSRMHILIRQQVRRSVNSPMLFSLTMTLILILTLTWLLPRLRRIRIHVCEVSFWSAVWSPIQIHTHTHT